MKTYNISLEESMNLEELDRERALKEFAKGSDVYAKLAKNIWLKFDNENDTHLPKLEDGIKYYISINAKNNKERQEICNNRYSKGQMIEFGYTITAHVSQGSEYKNATIYYSR